MKNKLLSILMIFAAFIAVFPAYADNSGVWLSMEYNLGGADSPYYLPEAYYASPVVEDLNKDGKAEIIFGNYSLNVLDGATGSLLWKVNGGKDRTQAYQAGNDIGILCDLEVADIDGDGYAEIIAAHAKGIVSVLSYDGYMKSGWPKQLSGAEGNVYAAARSLEVSDLNNDGRSEIIVGASSNSAENVWVYDCNGRILPGWPQLAANQNAAITYDKASGYSYGVFMDGVTAGDINGDGIKEVLVATDTAYLCAYDIYGKLVPANRSVFDGRTWGKVALWEDVKTETNMNFNEGWGWDITGTETRSELYKGELGHAMVKVCDVDNNGKNEVITSAIILDRNVNKNSYTGDYDSSKYMSFFIFNGDRTRFAGWESSPSDKNYMGAPLVQDPNAMSSGVQAEPVVCDLNNDGVNEIIINTYDGCVHAFSVNNASKEYGNFPYRIPQTSGVFETASGVVCKDIDADGKNEVIFVTATDDVNHTMKHGKKGGIYILNSDGTALSHTAIPDGYQIFETKLPAYTNSSLAKPVVADTDNDGAYEVVVNTRYSGICVYEIKGSKTTVNANPTNANILVNESKVAVSSYSINGYNYFKLRDIAMMVNGTAKQFNVGYNNKTKAVEIITGTPYSAVGGELSLGDGITKAAKTSSSKIFNKTALSTYIPYMIDGNNYFKLRDVCSMAGITVSWNEAERTISIASR